MTNVRIGNVTGCERRAVGSLPDHRAQSPDRLGKQQKFISVEVEDHRSIGKVECPAIAEHRLRLSFTAQDMLHNRHFLTVSKLAGDLTATRLADMLS